MVDLITERLRLRPIAVKDLDVVVTFLADERVMALLGRAYGREEWRVAGEAARSICARTVSVGSRWRVTVVGFAGLLQSPTSKPRSIAGIEVAWLLAFDRSGKGYATEAARAVVDDGFDRFGFAEIVVMTTPDNARSRRVMERLGMTDAPAASPSLPEHPARRSSIRSSTRPQPPTHARALSSDARVETERPRAPRRDVEERETVENRKLAFVHNGKERFAALELPMKLEVSDRHGAARDERCA